MVDSFVCCCYCCTCPVRTESECVSSFVTYFVMLATAYSGLGSLVFCSSIYKIVKKKKKIHGTCIKKIFKKYAYTFYKK